jgi:hypothetical protein
MIGEVSTPTRILPAAFAQEWFFGPRSDRHSTFPVPAAWRILGDITSRELVLALESLVERHESLRTRLATRDGRLVQVVQPSLGTSLNVVDLSQRRRELRGLPRMLGAEVLRPFDLTEDLARPTLFRLGRSDHLVALIVHHAVSDTWSRLVLDRDLTCLLGGPVQPGNRPGQRGQALQFGDYAAWEEACAKRPPPQAWVRILAGAGTSRLALPVANPAWTFDDGFRADPQALPRISAQTLGRLDAVARQQRTTTATVLATLLVTTWAPYACGDIVLGVLDSNRHRPELRDTVGFLVNPLPVRVDVSGDPTFRQLLERVKLGMATAFDHWVPFRALPDLLLGSDGPAREHLFDVSLNYFQPPAGALHEPDMPGGDRALLQRVEIGPHRMETAKGRGTFALLDYQLAVGDRGEVTGAVVGNERIFARSTLAALGRRLTVVATRAGRSPDARVSDLAPRTALADLSPG